MRRVIVLVLTATSLACSGDGDDGIGTATVRDRCGYHDRDRAVAEPELRRELLAMMEEDQAEQTGEVATNNYSARTDRLAEILDEHGWPGSTSSARTDRRRPG